MADNFFGESNLSMNMPKSVFLAVGFIALLMVAGILVLGSLNSVPTLSATENTNYNNSINIYNGSTVTLSTATPINSVAITSNNSWINFSGDFGPPGFDGPHINSDSNVFSSALGARARTVSLWHNFSQVQSNYCFIGLGANAGQQLYNICITSNNYSILGNALDKTFNVSIPLNSWVHMLISFNGSENTLYVNGVASGNATSAAYNTGASSLKIGTSLQKTSFINGSIDEVRFYMRNLSGTEVSQIYNSGRIPNSSLTNTNLSIWYPFNENGGTIIHDLSNSSNNASIAGSYNDSSGTVASTDPGRLWKSDGVNVTLSNTSDYNINGSTFTLTNIRYQFSGISFTYIGNALTAASANTAGLISNVSSGFVAFAVNIPTLFTIIGIVLVISAIALIIGVIYKVMLPNINSAFSKGL